MYHADGLGSVRALTDSSGSVVQTSGTDAFGIPDATLTSGSSPQPFGYTGEQQLAGGLVDLRARLYDPQLGRFLQADPLRKSGRGIGGWNRFAYVGNNPIAFTDPSGRAATQQALQVCAQNNWTCDGLTHDMAVELLNGNATDIDWTDISALSNGTPFDWLLFVAATVGTGGVGAEASAGRTGVTITAKQLKHVLERHTVLGNIAGKTTESLFADYANVANLIRAAESVPPQPGKWAGSFVREVTSTATVGWDAATRRATSTYTVVTDALGRLITAHPGLPK